MAKDVFNKKGFKVLLVDKQDMDNINSLGICDGCNADIEEGYYIAVLNHIMCKKCYEEWTDFATRYKEDIPIEEKNYIFYKRAFQSLDSREGFPQMNI